jgi:hypothetical protein
MSGALWIVLFFFAVSITNSSGPVNFFYVPMGLVILVAAIGFVVTSSFFWLVFFAGDTIRHALRRASRSPSRTTFPSNGVH